MSQTSGSITIDTSSMSAAVVEGLRPVFEQINQALTTLAPAEVGMDEFAQVLSDQGIDFPVLLASKLVQAGYVLVRRAAQPDPDTLDLTVQLDAAALKLQREDEWFRHGDPA